MICTYKVVFTVSVLRPASAPAHLVVASVEGLLSLLSCPTEGHILAVGLGDDRSVDPGTVLKLTF